jgi:hypothetical protein
MINENNERKGKVDWLLLIFLFLFTNQAVLTYKLVGLVLIYLFRFNFKFGMFKGRLPKFYFFILLLALFSFVFIVKEFSSDYITAFIVGNLFWVFSLMAAHQVKLSVERYGHKSVYETMKVFTFVNFIFCIYQLVSIMQITGTINPYNEYIPFPYGMSTGDNIYGAFLQNSYYNNMVSAILAVYFIFKRNATFTILSVICLVLIFGNFGTILFVSLLAGLLLAGIFAGAAQYSKGSLATWIKQVAPKGAFYLYLPGLVLLIGLMYYIASPKNLGYIVDKVKDKIFSVKSNDEHNYATMISNQEPEEKAFDPFSDYLEEKEKKLVGNTQLKSFDAKAGLTDKNLNAKEELTKTYIEKLQGKNLAVLETTAFLKASTTNLLFGAGTTRFSSLIAQKMSGYDSSRLFMNVLPKYIAKPYAENHMLLIKVRAESKDKALYSTANWPDSLYNQLFGEYGVIGMLLFMFFYVGYFVRYIGRWSYGLWILAILLPFAHLNYVFDTLCVIPFFELLMFADIDEHSESIPVND